MIRGYITLLLLCTSAALSAQNTLYQPCAACHGANGQGNIALGAPALAGQQAGYLSRQLTHFRDGTRGAEAADTYGAQMRGMSVNLSDAQIEELARYLSQLPVAPGAQMEASDTQPSPASLRNGSNYYQSSCGACHGGNAEGNVALNAPNLAMLDADYLKRQMSHFQNGRRGSAPGDRYGKQMQLMSNTLPDAAHLDDVIVFIKSLAGTTAQSAAK